MSNTRFSLLITPYAGVVRRLHYGNMHATNPTHVHVREAMQEAAKHQAEAAVVVIQPADQPEEAAQAAEG